MSTINISRKKTWFKPRISSAPTDGTAAYVITWNHEAYGDFFNTTGGNITYSGAAIAGDIEIYANENNGANSRSAEFKLSATTNRSPDYAETSTITCAWTITQEGTGCEPSLVLQCDEDIAGGTLPQSGGSFTFTAATTCANVTAYTMEQGGTFVTSSTTETSEGLVVRMDVQPNTDKESGRVVAFSISGKGVNGLDLFLDPTWEQNKADWEIKDADYIMFNYAWATEDGTDLDTFTILQFDNEQTPYIDGNTGVGYSRQYTVPADATVWSSDTAVEGFKLEFDPSTSILTWAGDNTGAGSEYTLIDFKKLKNLGRNATVYIFGNWYKCRKIGDCKIVLTAYKNGEPNPKPSYTDGFTIEGGEAIPGGTDIKVKNACYARSRSNYHDPLSRYSLMCFMKYDASNDNISLYNAKDNQDLLPTQYKDRIGLYRSFVVKTIIKTGTTEVFNEETNQETNCYDTAEYSFTGAADYEITVNPVYFFYANNTTAKTPVANFTVGEPVVSDSKDRWPDRGEENEHFVISDTALTNGVWSCKIHFDNEGTYRTDPPYEGTRMLRLSFNDIFCQAANGKADTFYLELTQRRQETP